MAQFNTDYDETFTVPVPLEVACTYFGSVDRIAENLDAIEHVEKLDDVTLWVVMTPLEKGPVTFRGEYRCRWQFPSRHVLTWEPAGPGNVRVHGEARFTAVGPSTTQVVFHQTSETEIELNMFFKMFAGPIVNHETHQTMRRYLERTRASLGRLAS